MRTSTITEFLRDVTNEVLKARLMYPEWQQDPVHGAAVAAEEAGEVLQAVNNYHWQQGDDTPEDIYKEAVQAAAMFCRFVVDSEWMLVKEDKPEGEAPF